MNRTRYAKHRCALTSAYAMWAVDENSLMPVTNWMPAAALDFSLVGEHKPGNCATYQHRRGLAGRPRTCVCSRAAEEEHQEHEKQGDKETRREERDERGGESEGGGSRCKRRLLG